MDMQHKTKKPWYKRVWVWIGIVVLLLIIGGATASEDNPKLADESSSVSSSKQEQKTVFKVGDTIDFDSKKVTVVSAERNWNSGNEFISPESGKEFVKVQVKIENNSDSEASYNTFDWKMQDSDGNIQDVDASAFSADGALDSGNLASSGKVAGFLVFQVSAGDTGLTLRYESSFWSDKKIEIKL